METLKIIFFIITLITAILCILSLISLLRYCFNKYSHIKTFLAFVVSWLLFLALNIGLFFFIFNNESKISTENNNQYTYDLQCFTYYTNNNSVGKEINKPELFRLWYSVHERQARAFPIELSGNVVFIKGPPFSFQIILSDVGESVKSVHLKKCIILNSKENNILELDDVNIDYELLFPDTTGQEIVGKIEQENDYQLYKTNGMFYRKDKLDEIATEQMIDEINSRRSIIYFKNIPIDYLNDETFIINVEIIVIIEDGEEFIIKIEEEYIRNLKKEKMHTAFSPNYYKNIK